MDSDVQKSRRVVIHEGTLKKNVNPPPKSERPPPPKAQIAPTAPAPKQTGSSNG